MAVSRCRSALRGSRLPQSILARADEVIEQAFRNAAIGGAQSPFRVTWTGPAAGAAMSAVLLKAEVKSGY
jgi:hypothetical protein